VLGATVSPAANGGPPGGPSPASLLLPPPTIEDAAPLDDRFDRIAPQAIAEVSPRRDVEDQEVRELSGFHAPEVALPSDRVGRVDRRCRDRLRREESVVMARQGD